MGEKQNLSEAQVWDDSALQAVWNASVKEYQAGTKPNSFT